MARGSESVTLVASGPLAQLARALASHARGHKFKSCTVHGNPSGSVELLAALSTRHAAHGNPSGSVELLAYSGPVTAAKEFSFRYDRWCGWILGLFASGRRFSHVLVGEDVVDVRLGIAFQGTIDRSAIRGAHRWTGRVLGWGAHGWRGRWLVNGSSKGIIVLEIDPAARGRVLGCPVKVSELALSLEEPEAFAAALSLDLA